MNRVAPQLHLRFALLAAALALVPACQMPAANSQSLSPDQAKAMDDYQKKADEYQKRSESALESYETQLARYGKILDREEVLLAKREEQARRFDAILTRWEKK